MLRGSQFKESDVGLVNFSVVMQIFHTTVLFEA